MSDFHTMTLKNEKIYEKKELLDLVEREFPNGIPMEKSAVRKVVDILKMALKNINSDEISNSIYHLKLALLKVAYQIYRKGASYGSQKVKKLIDEGTRRFFEDLEKIDQSDGDKNKMVEKAKKVYKDFLNVIIIKSYYPKEQYGQGSQKNIQNQDFNRSSYRRW